MSSLVKRVRALEQEQAKQGGSGVIGYYEDGERTVTIAGVKTDVTPEEFEKLYPGGLLIHIVRDAGWTGAGR